MTRPKMGAAMLNTVGLGALLHARELAQRNVPGFNFKRVDTMLARFKFVMDLNQDTSVGPVLPHLLVVVHDGEYQDMADVAFHAKLHTLPSADFDFRAFVPQINQLASAVGLRQYQVGGPGFGASTFWDKG